MARYMYPDINGNNSNATPGDLAHPLMEVIVAGAEAVEVKVMVIAIAMVIAGAAGAFVSSFMWIRIIELFFLL